LFQNSKFKIKNYTRRLFSPRKKRALLSLVLIVLIILPIYFFFSGRNTEASWWNDTWGYRKKITINKSQVAGELQNFPVLVSITDTNLITGAQTDGDDLVFTDSTGKKLSHEIESYTSGTGALVAWVKLPNLTKAKDTEIYLYYGNATATSQQDKTNVWDGNFKMVQHMNQDPSGTAPQMTDSTSNANNGTSGGTMTSGDLVDAKVGKGLDFDGTDDYVDTTVDLDDYPITGCAWIKPQTDDNWMSQFIGDADFEFNMGNDSGAYYLSIYNNRGGLNSAFGSIILDQWQYVCATIDVDNMAKLYINGGLVAGPTDIDDPWHAGNGFVIGARQGYTSQFPGNIEEVKISNSVRTPEWIATEYANQNNPSAFLSVSGKVEQSPGGPVGYWSFDEGQGTTAHDESSSSNDGTITGATWKPESECVSGKCLGFDGTSDYVDMGNATGLSGLSTLTIGAWVKINATPSLGNIYVIAGKEQEYKIDINSDGNVLFLLKTSEGGWTVYITSATALSVNTWYHIMATYDGSMCKMYINGKQDVNTGNPSGAIISNSNKVVVGADDQGGYYDFFSGSIDEPKIYPYARTQAQILQDYNAGLASQSAPQGASAAFGSESSKWLTDGLVGYWKMDESLWNGTSGEVIDASGNNNNGTSAGGATTAGGKFGNGGSFDGVDDYVIKNPMSPALFPNITISTWIKPSVAPSGVSNNRAVNVASSDAWVGITSSGVVVSNIYDGSNHNLNSITSGNIVGKWTHVVLVSDSTSQKLYINGQYDNSNSVGALNWEGDSRFQIGGISDNAPYDFNGQIDETRIYNRALSPDEIKKLYEWAPGPVLHLKMDEKVQGDAKTLADDSTYGNNGTTHYGANTTGMDCTTPGKFGSSCNFDGVDDYVSVPNPVAMIDLSQKTFSASAWVKNSTDYVPFLTKGASNNVSWYLTADEAGRIQFGINRDTDLRIVTNSVIPGDGKSHFVAVSFLGGDDVSGVSIYLDGTKVTGYQSQQNGVGAYVSDSGQELRIGRDDWGGYCGGQIDDVRIYNYARTQQQILEDMLGTPEPAGGGGNGQPIAHYNFNEGYGSVAHNFGYGGAVLNANLIAGGGANNSVALMWEKNGKNGKAVEFDGDDDYAEVPDNALLDFGANDFSVSFWVNKKSACSNWNNVWGVNKWDTGSSPGNNEWVINLCSDGETDKFFFAIESGSTSYTVVDPDTHSLNNWYHVVGLREGTNLKLYVDGKNKKTTSIGTVSVNNAGRSLRIANSNANSYYTNALFDDVKIYPYALTEDEIKTDYNSGASAQWGSAGTVATTGSPTNSTSGVYCVPGSTEPCAAPVGEWLMDKKVAGDAQTIYDTSGNGNNGTTNDGANNTGMDCTVPGKVGSACSFDGVDDATDTGNFSIGSSSFTVSGWIKAAIRSQNNYFINQQSGSGQRWYLATNHDDGRLIFYSDVTGWVLGNNTIPNNQWTHFSIVETPSSTKFYLNGLLDKGDGAGGCNASLNNLPIQIGHNTNSGSFLNGSIDQVRIYNYARTPAQIAWEYNQGKPIAEWKFDECQGGTVHDNSGNGNNGTINLGASGQTTTGTCSANANTPWYNGRTGKYAASLNFDGGDDYADIGDVSLLDGATSLTISFWYFLSSGATLAITPLEKWETNPSYIITSFTGNHPYVAVRQTSSAVASYYWVTDYTWEKEKWVHFTWTWKAGSPTINHVYIDGVDKALTSELDMGPSSVGNSPDHLKFGNAMNGQIDDIKIFNYALTAEQVKQLYNNSSALNFQ
jgi:hypothetical protein